MNEKIRRVVKETTLRGNYRSRTKSKNQSVETPTYLFMPSEI
jgi:hypothetical protein